MQDLRGDFPGRGNSKHKGSGGINFALLEGQKESRSLCLEHGAWVVGEGGGRQG